MLIPVPGTCQKSLMQRSLRQAKSSGDRFSYFKNGWNLVDLAYLSLLGMAIVTWIYIILDPSVLSLGTCIQWKRIHHALPCSMRHRM